MDLINWSLNAIDTLFSTRSLGLGEPECPGGTFPAGYTMDGWQTWRVVCLAGLSIEDAEDIYLFGTVITGFLLIGVGLALVYRRNKRAEPAVQTPPRLPAGLKAMVRGTTSHNERSMVNTLETLTAAVKAQNNTIERMRGYIRERPAQNETLERQLEHIAERITAVVRSQNQKNDNTTERKFDTIMGRLAALQREIERPASEC
ncbi:uncharacterized protein LOC143420881 [Maylandia zebra]|uniref:uncharacterized protein LOC143420881 n=1 Tax=Maylandia zebra TaxID=106582 RepID=UPI00403CD81A